MNIGIAGLLPDRPDRAVIAAKAGFVYSEISLMGLVKFEASQIKEYADILSENSLPCISNHGMFPGDIKLIGNGADKEIIKDYMHSAFELTRPLGAKLCVLGSGNARRTPEGYSTERAYDEFALLCSDVIAPICEQYGKTLVIEPLNFDECNIVNTLNDAVRVVKAVDRPSVKMLADYFHVLKNGESLENYSDYKDLLVHAHISSADRRIPTHADGTDYKAFFKALRDADYSANVSVEAYIPDENGEFADHIKQALEILSDL